MRRIAGYSLLASLFLLFACEKEIDVDYHSVAPLYVAEGGITADGTQVRITTTRDVLNNSNEKSLVNSAVVVLSSDMGIRDTLHFMGAGRYYSAVRGVEGVTYRLDIGVDGMLFSSTSVMQGKPDVEHFRFVWKKVMTEDMLFGELLVNDRPDQNNYYFFHMYRNGVGYRWAVMRDNKDPGGVLKQLFSCTTRKAMEENSDADALHDGDNIRVEVRAIDKRCFDYFFSMQQMVSTGTNPIANYTGGCLGYFSAYGEEVLNCTFKTSEVETSDD